jgi:GNAT superfamily N-acetyltransferase
MDLAIRHLQAPYLSEAEIAASFDIMGLDTQLIDDETYYVVQDGSEIVGCGGWSKRATLYGGNHSASRDASLLDPEHDAARIRAMYTHPDHARRGIGRLILKACEAAAAAERFRHAELVATLSGEPLYSACGYRLVEEMHAETASDVAIPVRSMRKDLLPPH